MDTAIATRLVVGQTVNRVPSSTGWALSVVSRRMLWSGVVSAHGVEFGNIRSFADPHHGIHIDAKSTRRTQITFLKNPKRAYRAPIAPLMAVSTETRLEAPTCGVAMGNFPPAFWRLESAISTCDAVSAVEYCQPVQTHQLSCLRL